MSSFGEQMIKTVKLADKMAVICKRDGKTAIRAKCPDCDGYLQMRYSGTRAFRFWCDGTCGKRMMG